MKRDIADEVASNRLTNVKRGRPGKDLEELKREIRTLRRKLAASKKRIAQAEALVRLQMEYVRGAALKFERKDRGLLSELIARIRSECSISDLCDALALTRRDYYRTIKPLLDQRPAAG